MSQDRSQSVRPASTVMPALLPASGWIIGMREDLLLFLGTPLLLIAAFATAERYWSLAAVGTFATVLAMGHYLPGLMRAYGDPALFRRFRLRFVLAPIFLISMALVMATHESQAFLLVVVVWGAWHWMMQTYGLARIYDAKVKNYDNASARLDYALCIAWFGVLYWQTDGATGVLMRFFRAGGRLAPDLMHWTIRLWVVVTVAITITYIVHMVRRIGAGHPPSLLKLALLIISFFFYLYAFGYSSSKLIAFALFEGYHDIQYLAIVWVFNRNRAAKDPAAGTFTRFLFRKRWLLIVLYVLLCLGFGSYDYVVRNINEGTLANLALGLITGLALVHFYFDGFIWRIREPETRATLDVAGDDVVKVPRLPSHIRHGLLWAVFAVPLLLLGAWEVNTSADDESAYRAAMQARPASHKSHYMLALELQKAGDFEEALLHVRKARELRPGYDLYEMSYGTLLLKSGNLSEDDLDEIDRCFQIAAKTQSDFPDLYRNWAVALRQRGRLDAAGLQYRQAIYLEPHDAETNFNYATLLAQQQEFNDAIWYCRQTIHYDVNHAGAHGLLGLMLWKLRQPASAIEHFRTALSIDPTQVRVMANLALALATVSDPALRNTGEAVRLAEKARELSPSPDAEVLRNLAVSYAAVERFEDAMSAAKQAAELYRATGQDALASNITEALERYRQGRP